MILEKINTIPNGVVLKCAPELRSLLYFKLKRTIIRVCINVHISFEFGIH